MIANDNDNVSDEDSNERLKDETQAFTKPIHPEELNDIAGENGSNTSFGSKSTTFTQTVSSSRPNICVTELMLVPTIANANVEYIEKYSNFLKELSQHQKKTIECSLYKNIDLMRQMHDRKLEIMEHEFQQNMELKRRVFDKTVELMNREKEFKMDFEKELQKLNSEIVTTNLFIKSEECSIILSKQDFLKKQSQNIVPTEMNIKQSITMTSTEDKSKLKSSVKTNQNVIDEDQKNESVSKRIKLDDQLGPNSEVCLSFDRLKEMKEKKGEEEIKGTDKEFTFTKKTPIAITNKSIKLITMPETLKLGRGNFLCCLFLIYCIPFS